MSARWWIRGSRRRCEARCGSSVNDHPHFEQQRSIEGSNMTTGSSPLRLGILGCANIAKQFLRDIAPSGQIKAVAVASRSLETAATFASAHGIEPHYGSYELLLADKDIDAVYIPLPNSLHAEWAVKAAVAGKHVL